ncbi:NADPH-dependent 2,4-dienoyl-CoA reductase [Paraburkholderia strydomiana]|jgi:2,4-dienoyl-CoA reductase (NADPH2)|uniref:NADPH-dependent 2,4-dienoyl-CoA reductase n=1 Tax=Paraburkholderia strydomiana TaxID=1245417 RepID=A0ABW9EQJ8_9BURK
MELYPHLMASLQVGAVTLRNRIVMGAMHTRLETLDRPHERVAAFYRTRAQGEVGLILTCGHSPNREGIFEPNAPLFCDHSQIKEHRSITEAVHAAGGLIALQLLHAGRYARHPLCVGPSSDRARINPVVPRELTTEEVWQTIEDFAKATELAREAGYDGVEIMGSEGYLINQFTAILTNHRTDEFGGSGVARMRFPLEILRAIRRRIGDEFMVIYRISAVDLVDGGMSGPEVAELARNVEAAGADMLNTGIGWHESAVPTIAASVPRSAWLYAIENVKAAVTCPVIASNRINTPDGAERLLATGSADLVSMARPLLADPDFAKKSRLGRPGEINTCIACNQACLDRIFTDRSATCLVNPRAGREIEFVPSPIARRKKLAVIGGGPAGMAFAINASERGHYVSLFESAASLGGQLNLARAVPGKSEFNEMLRYFRTRLATLGVDVRLGADVKPSDFRGGGFDEIVVATGVRPRIPDIEGADHPKVLSYIDVLGGSSSVGNSVAIIGAGGVGFDVAEFLVGNEQESVDPETFFQAWGVDSSLASGGGLIPAQRKSPLRQVYMFQRKDEPLGKRLGKSTGWILKSRLRRANVEMISGVTYQRVDDAGLHYTRDGQLRVLAVDNVIFCTGQECERDLYERFKAEGIEVRVIGGADFAGELDALRAIEQATRLAIAV